MNLVAYSRVSTDGQVDGYGLVVQREAMREWARKAGHRIVTEVEDIGVSGTLTDRPGLSTVLEELRRSRRVQGVLVPRLDRLARSPHRTGGHPRRLLERWRRGLRR